MSKKPIIQISVKWFDEGGTEQEVSGEYLTWESAEEGLGKLERAYEKGVVEAEQRVEEERSEE